MTGQIDFEGAADVADAIEEAESAED